MKITELQCPVCGGQLTINENNPLLAVCKYCNTPIALEWENEQPHFTKNISHSPADDLLTQMKNEPNPYPPARLFRIAMACLACLLLIVSPPILTRWMEDHKNTPVTSTSDSENSTDVTTSEIVLSGNLGQLASSIFHMPTEQITKSELSKVQWLEITYTIDHTKIGYSFDSPNSKEAQLIWMTFPRNSDLGKETLRQFTNLKKLTVKNAITKEDLEGLTLTSIGGYFQSPQQVAELVEDVSSIKEIQFLSGVEDLSGLEQFTNLESLSIGSCDLTDIDSLRNLPNLKILKLEGFDAFSDFSIFSTMPNIEELSLDSENLKTLHFLNGMDNLKRLEISDANLLSLDGIEICSNLEALTVSNCQELKNMHAVTTLSNLKELSLELPYGCEQPDLRSLTKLKHLRLYHFEDFTYFDTLSQLQSLTLDSCYFSQSPDLSKLTALKELTVQSFSSSGKSVAFITSIPFLEKLDMSGIVTYDDISAIFNMNDLKELQISGIECKIDFNKINDNHTLETLHMDSLHLYTNVQITNDKALTYIDYDDVVLDEHTSFLGHFKALKHLNIQSNKLTNLAFVTNLPTLETIDFADNYIAELLPLAKLKNLREVICTGNPILNTNVLSDTVNLICE